MNNWLQSTLVRVIPLALTAWVAVAPPAQAQAQTQAQTQAALLAPTVTAIEGTSERLVSYRNQEHMWQTADGATHVVVNTGTQPDERSLRLYTSIDNGVTWVPGIGFDDSNANGTADVASFGDTAEVAYSTRLATIAVARLSYDPNAKTWSLSSTEVAYASAETAGINPALARDAAGRTWLAFSSQDRNNSDFGIKLVLKADAASPWVDTGMVFGPIDNVSLERSARPVVTRDGIGLVYTVHRETFWAQRSDSWPLDQAWSVQLLHTAQGQDVDPFGSHYSVTVDDDHVVHMALVDNGQLLYMRRLAQLGFWTKKVLTGPVRATYVQAVVAAGNVMLISNHSTFLRVFQSSDGGRNWSNTHWLLHAAGGGGLDYSRPRNEAPGRSTSPVPVLQQFVDGGIQRAMVFQVPVEPVPATAVASPRR